MSASELGPKWPTSSPSCFRSERLLNHSCGLQICKKLPMVGKLQKAVNLFIILHKGVELSPVQSTRIRLPKEFSDQDSMATCISLSLENSDRAPPNNFSEHGGELIKLLFRASNTS